MENRTPDPEPPREGSMLWLWVLAGFFFLFVLAAGLIGLTP